jgi:hypothetical protein
MRRRRVVITIRKMVSAVHMDVLVISVWGREERRACATCELIDEESANQSADESYKCSNRDGGGWLAEGYASDKDDGFYAWFAHSVSNYTCISRRKGEYIPSRRTVMKGRMKNTHLPALVRLSTSMVGWYVSKKRTDRRTT